MNETRMLYEKAKGAFDYSRAWNMESTLRDFLDIQAALIRDLLNRIEQLERRI